MGKFDGFLICTDLDGTLLNDAYKISPENEKAIRYYQAEGGRLTFITGRLYYFAQDSYDLVKPNAPIGTSNGGSVYDFETKKNWSKGLKVQIAEDNSLTISCSLMIRYGYSVVDVANAVQQVITTNVESTTGVKVSAIHVNVCGIVHK